MTAAFVTSGMTASGILSVVLAYFLGNISPAIILGKLHGIDIKKVGSGNAGTTNVLRTLGKKAALITMAVDILKGFAAVKLGFLMGGYTAGAICAVAAFCGHIWPCFYHFKGGKGVATAFGVIVAVNWKLGLAVLAVVAVFLVLTQRMSVGSLAGAISFPLLCWIMEPDFLAAGVVMAVIVVIKHRANIRRLLRGEEPKMSFKK